MIRTPRMEHAVRHSNMMRVTGVLYVMGQVWSSSHGTVESGATVHLHLHQRCTEKCYVGAIPLPPPSISPALARTEPVQCAFRFYSSNKLRYRFHVTVLNDKSFSYLDFNILLYIHYSFRNSLIIKNFFNFSLSFSLQNSFTQNGRGV